MTVYSIKTNGLRDAAGDATVLAVNNFGDASYHDAAAEAHDKACDAIAIGSGDSVGSRRDWRPHMNARAAHRAAAAALRDNKAPATEPEPPMSHDRRQYEHVAATMAEVSSLPGRDDDSTNASTAAGMAGLAAEMAEACGVDHRGWEFARAGWRAAAKAWAAAAKEREAPKFSQYARGGLIRPGSVKVDGEGCWSMRFPRDGEMVSTIAAHDRAVMCGEASGAWMAKTGGTPQ